MMVSTKGRYALRIMLDLAIHEKEGYISLKEIAQRQEISMKYLEAIVAILNHGGMLESHRGKDGGYSLKKSAVEYSVGSILKLTEGSLAPVACLACDKNECNRAEDCITLPMWKKLDKVINEYLSSVSLKDLIENSSDLYKI